MADILDWNRIFMNDHPASFLLEVAFRSVMMSIIILVTLRASGKRGIKQLSIFELVLIIGLGSAAGDPMFYEDVGIVPALVVFTVVISLYLLITRLTDKFTWVERILEGEPSYLVKNGAIIVDAFDKSSLSQDEFFAGLRALNVEHLGQVRTALIETSGTLSVLFYSDEETKPGLPIFPEPLSHKIRLITVPGNYACSKCGYITWLSKNNNCPDCECGEWVLPLQTKRVS